MPRVASTPGCTKSRLTYSISSRSESLGGRAFMMSLISAMDSGTPTDWIPAMPISLAKIASESLSGSSRPKVVATTLASLLPGLALTSAQTRCRSASIASTCWTLAGLTDRWMFSRCRPSLSWGWMYQPCFFIASITWNTLIWSEVKAISGSSGRPSKRSWGIASIPATSRCVAS